MLVTGKSRIHGTGLFTDSPLRARQKIGEYTGERISVREGRRRAKQQKRKTIVEVSDTVAIDGSVNPGPFTYINHSCEPNVFIRTAYGRAEFYALRNVKAGEELTFDYGESHHEDKPTCHCGSKKCRGVLE
jgi:uncharacterized protein